MSKLHTLKDGYTTRKGQTNPAVMVTMTEEERKIFGMKPLYFYIIIAIVAVLVIGIIIKLSVGENKKEETNDDFSFD